MILEFWSRFYNKLCFITVFFIGISGLSQNLEYLQNKYPNHSEVALEVSDRYIVTLDKNKQLNVSSNSLEDYVILKSAVSGVDATESIVFSDLVPIIKYEAYSLVLNNNGREKKVPVQMVKDRPFNRRGIFDSDVKLKVFTYSNLSLGVRKLLKSDRFFKDPMLLHRFNFATGLPAEKRRLEIVVDNDIEIDYKIFNDLDSRILKTVSPNKKTTTYVFEALDTPVYNSDNYMAGRNYELPHIHFWISSYYVKGEKIPVLGSVSSLYNYYKTFLGKVNQEEDETLKAFTLKLVEREKTDKKKLEVIFNYVQDNIKYVAFESGYEGFVPRNASLVFERKFGDCKDMTSIIVEMAKYAEISGVKFAWIGTRELPYTYEELPTPAVDNHMIAVYETAKDIMFLDGTDSEVPFGVQPAFIQGKEVLIANGENFEVVKVPVIDAFQNRYVDSYVYSLIDDGIEGKGVLNTYGLSRSYFLSSLSDEQRNRKKEISIVLERGSNKMELKSFVEYNLKEKELPYRIEYTFKNDNYAVQSGEETYLNMFLYKPFLDLQFQDDRKTTADLSKLQLYSINATLEIPDGYELVYVPKNVEFENDFLKYDFTYEKGEGVITLKYSIENKKLLLRPNEIPHWNETIKKLKLNYSETIMIKKHEK